MNYKKIKLQNFNLHTIQTNKFKTITIKINFKRPLKKEDITKRNILSELLIKSTKKYHSERLLSIATEELYGINYSSYSLTSGRYGILGFNFSFLNEEYTETGIIKEVIEFIKEIIFNPNIENDAFEEKSFSIAKNIVKDDIEITKENPNQYSLNRMYDLLDEKSFLSYHPEGDLEDLQKVTSKNLYDFYKDILQNDMIDIFVLGDLKEENIHEISKLFHFEERKTYKQSHYITDVLRREKVKEVKEKSTFTQSKMCIAYNLNDLSDFERDYVSYIYSFILGGGGDSKLFKIVREKNSLCYSISSFINRIYSLMTIRLGFDQKNYDKVLINIEKCLDDMKKGKFDEKAIKRAKSMYKNSLREIYDRPYSILNMYASKEYLKLDDIEEREKKIEKVDKNSIVEFAKKVEENLIYCLEGGSHEEKTK